MTDTRDDDECKTVLECLERMTELLDDLHRTKDITERATIAAAIRTLIGMAAWMIAGDEATAKVLQMDLEEK